jgi:hypothetical protein
MSRIVKGIMPDMSKIRAECAPLVRSFLEEGLASEPAARPSFAQLAQRFCPLDSFLSKHIPSAQV